MMLVELRLEVPVYPYGGETNLKYAFWRRLSLAKQRTYSVKESDLRELSSEQKQEADRLEREFGERFPYLLERRINTEVGRTFAAHPRRRRAPTIAVTLISIEYHSLHTLLELSGIDNAALRDFVISVLNIYSPPIFREIVDAQPDVRINANATVVADDLEIVGNSNSARAGAEVASKATEALDRAWWISNTSLVVPVLLALAIFYYAFNALLHEMEAARTQAALAQTERAGLINALQAQNAKLAELVAAHPANNDNFRAFADILLAVVKSSSDRTAPPAQARPMNTGQTNTAQ